MTKIRKVINIIIFDITVAKKKKRRGWFQKSNFIRSVSVDIKIMTLSLLLSVCFCGSYNRRREKKDSLHKYNHWRQEKKDNRSRYV